MTPAAESRPARSMATTKPAPRVSIGLPVYNGDRYLEGALQSLLAQTFSDFELIICDNASTDGTADICRAYAAEDERISYHRNPENLGATRNFNLVFELSSGEYFRWASHDDLCAPELLERCVAELDRHPTAALCYPRTTVIDEEGHEVGFREDDLILLDSDPVKRHKAFLLRFRTNAWCEPVFGVIRSGALRRTRLLGNFNSADVILLEELALLGTFHEVPEHLFFRRVHPDISTRANRTPEAIAEWFDPANCGRVVAPVGRRLLEHFRAVRTSPLGMFAKMGCYSHVTTLMISWSPGLAQELAGVVKSRFSRLGRRTDSLRDER